MNSLPDPPASSLFPFPAAAGVVAFIPPGALLFFPSGAFPAGAFPAAGASSE